MAGTQTQIFVTETKQILNTLSLRSLKREKAKKKKKKKKKKTHSWKNVILKFPKMAEGNLQGRLGVKDARFCHRARCKRTDSL